MNWHVFGIRHHGPGCARALRAALEALAPDAVLVEGPPDADDALAQVALPGMVPPVALLVHAVDDPRLSSFYPFAEFSPEWQALRYAAKRGVPARFMDLPSTNTLALRKQAAEKAASESPDPESGESLDAVREDPVGKLAEAAGFADPEQWWDVQVEQRHDASGLFESILEGMAALREGRTEDSPMEQRREAHMRATIRAAQKDGFERIAVVCGAWHAPALAELGPAKADTELLKGLPKVKVSVTWIPWTYARLAFRSGYGAGVDSPGWVDHVWKHGGKAPAVWATLAARLLRDQDLDASAASVIEAVRLAHAAASLRELPAPGLAEMREAIQAVLCGGNRAPISLIRSRLEIGDRLGEVPEQAGQVPVMRDFERETKRLRLKLSEERMTLELDLRKELDRDRSRLFFRLKALGLPWARLVPASKGAGTFKEAWQLGWDPKFTVELVAANLHGNTIETAAARALSDNARQADIAGLSQLVELAIFGHLQAALEALLGELDARAAASSDVVLQMNALEPLARLVRYSDVRETRAEHVLPVLLALFERVFVALPPSCTQLDDDAAAGMLGAIGRAHGACLLLDNASIKRDWFDSLRKLLNSSGVHPRVRGRACRLLVDQHELAEGELNRLTSLALSPAVEPGLAAQWVEGLVAGEGLLLVHQEELLSALDAWLSGLSDDTFQAQLPLLRRAFSGIAAPERRALGERLSRARRGEVHRTSPREVEEHFDPEKVAEVLPVLEEILGVSHV